MKELSESEKREAGFVMKAAFDKLEKSLESIKPPDMSRVMDLMKSVEAKKATLQTAMTQMKKKLGDSGIDVEKIEPATPVKLTRSKPKSKPKAKPRAKAKPKK